MDLVKYRITMLIKYSIGILSDSAIAMQALTESLKSQSLDCPSPTSHTFDPRMDKLEPNHKPSH